MKSCLQDFCGFSKSKHIWNVQVFFVGTEAKIDMRPSSVWLKEKTAHWTFKKHLKIGVKRDEALDILSSEGTLLVLCSLIDNMPYVVAEAAVSSRHLSCCLITFSRCAVRHEWMTCRIVFSRHTSQDSGQ